MRLLALLKCDRSGAATVEFGLLGPLVITMMLGVLQMGVAMWSYNSLRSVASETARYAVTNSAVVRSSNSPSRRCSGRTSASKASSKTRPVMRARSAIAATVKAIS